MSKFYADPFPTDTPSSYPNPAMKDLLRAVLELKNETEAKNFFRDLLTMAEMKEFANRWQMVKMLYQGASYGKIAAKLKVSTATVTRVAHWLKNGFGGYKAIADRLFETKFKDAHTPSRYYRSGKRRGIPRADTI